MKKVCNLICIIALCFFVTSGISQTSVKLTLYEKCTKEVLNNQTSLVYDWRKTNADFIMDLQKGKISIYDSEYKITERFKINSADLQLTNKKNGTYAYNCYDYLRQVNFTLILQIPNDNDTEQPMIKIIYRQSNGIIRLSLFKAQLPNSGE